MLKQAPPAWSSFLTVAVFGEGFRRSRTIWRNPPGGALPRGARIRYNRSYVSWGVPPEVGRFLAEPPPSGGPPSPPQPLAGRAAGPGRRHGRASVVGRRGFRQKGGVPP